MNYFVSRSSGKENAENQVSYRVCFVCNQPFENLMAYESHLSGHNKEVKACMSLNNHTLLSNSRGLPIRDANLFPSTQNLSHIGGSTGHNLSHVANSASFPLGHPNPNFLNVTSPLNSTQFFRNNLGNSYSISGKPEFFSTDSLSSIPYPMSLSSNQVSHCNSHNIMHAGQNPQHYNPNIPVFHCLPSTNRDPGFSSNNVTGMSASKKFIASLILPMERGKPQAKELPLLMVLEKSLQGQQRYSGAKVEDLTDLDLSLRL